MSSRAMPSPDPASGGTLIRLEGRDALPLLHRLTTQKLDDLSDGEARLTLFCDFRGRLLHRVAVLRATDAVWLVRDDAPAHELIAHLDRHIFRDDVRMVDAGAGLAIRARGGAGDRSEVTGRW